MNRSSASRVGGTAILGIVRANIAWADIENCFREHGARISEGNGSRVRVALNGRKATFHRPHPEKETDRGAVR